MFATVTDWSGLCETCNSALRCEEEEVVVARLRLGLLVRVLEGEKGGKWRSRNMTKQGHLCRPYRQYNTYSGAGPILLWSSIERPDV